MITMFVNDFLLEFELIPWEDELASQKQARVQGILKFFVFLEQMLCKMRDVMASITFTCYVKVSTDKFFILFQKPI